MEANSRHRSALQIYLAVIMTIVALLLAAILTFLIYAGVKLADGVKSIDSKANALSSKVDSFNANVEKLNPFN